MASSRLRQRWRLRARRARPSRAGLVSRRPTARVTQPDTSTADALSSQRSSTVSSIRVRRGLRVGCARCSVDRPRRMTIGGSTTTLRWAGTRTCSAVAGSAARPSRAAAVAPHATAPGPARSSAAITLVRNGIGPVNTTYTPGNGRCQRPVRSRVSIHALVAPTARSWLRLTTPNCSRASASTSCASVCAAWLRPSPHQRQHGVPAAGPSAICGQPRRTQRSWKVGPVQTSRGLHDERQPRTCLLPSPEYSTRSWSSRW